MKSAGHRIFTGILLLFLLEYAFGASDSDNHTVTVELSEIASLGLNDTTAITLTLNTPTVAGMPPGDDTDNSKLLYYTSVVATGTSRSITVVWKQADAAPAGTALKAEATSIPANCGTSAGQITVSNTATTIITGIQGCATGTGVNGAEITYTLTVADTSQVIAGDSSTVTITFTLTDYA